jgi:hypothetical protein
MEPEGSLPHSLEHSAPVFTLGQKNLLSSTLPALHPSKTKRNKQTKNSVALRPQANYTDEFECQLLWIEECRVVTAADPLWSLISVF